MSRLIKNSGCDVLPICFQESNSDLFQRASKLSVTLRLGLYMHEIRRRLNIPIEFNILPIIDRECIPDVSEPDMAQGSANLGQRNKFIITGHMGEMPTDPIALSLFDPITI